MEGNLNALGLILVVLLTVMVLRRFGSRPKSFARVMAGAAAAFGVILLLSCFTIVFYREAHTYQQLLIPWVCLTLVLTFTRLNRTCAVAAIVIALSSLLLRVHVLSLVGPDASYTGDPEWAERSTRRERRSKLTHAREALAAAASQKDRSYPRGWISDSELRELLPEALNRDLAARSVVTKPFWHSFLTGLYEKKHRTLALWYPGGPLKQGIHQLEYRPRQAQ